MNLQHAWPTIGFTSYTSTPKIKDSRLRDRFHQVVKAIQQSPGKSFPAIFSSKAELNGFYRLMNNDEVGFSTIMDATYDSTLKGCLESELVLAIHDTTQFLFPGTEPIEGLGRLNQKNGERGFFGHFCIASTLKREILGVLGLNPWVRPKEPRKKRIRSKSDRSNEKLRWLKMILEVQAKAANNSKLIHLADRDADDYATFAPLVEAGIRFVIRAVHNRTLKNQPHGKLFESLRVESAIIEKEVPISGRKKSPQPRSNKAHPPRQTRIARLGISAKSVEIPRGLKIAKDLPAALVLNFVRVFELETPQGETPIEWILITTESIQGIENIKKIVDVYSCRWIIEEYFKVLKTGCAFQKRKFESLHSILNCLAILAPIACNVYNLKILAREHSEAQAIPIVTPAQVQLLAHATNQSETNLNSVSSVMWAVAALGGHLKHNGLPGWQVLMRGYEKLLQIEEGWNLAIQFRTQPLLLYRDM